MSRTARGFTLIELLITLAILALLATLLSPLAELAVQRQRETELRQALRSLRNAIDAYKQASDEGHIGKAVGASGYPPDLQTLVSGVTDLRDPQGGKLYFLRRLPRDPLADSWLGDDPAGHWALRSYASEPDAPQPGDDVFDIASRASGTALDGSAYADW